MRYWKEYFLNGVEINARLDTKTHRWQIWFGKMSTGDDSRGWRRPDLSYSKARGQSVVEVLDELKTLTRKKEP